MSQKILVLLGGDSPEREVSIRSGRSIAGALRSAGFEVEEFDPESGDELLRAKSLDCDAVFPILHGINGEDGKIQRKLEDFGVKYLGSDSTASENSFYKDKTHEILEPHGVLMAKYAVVGLDDMDNELFKNPFVLKPLDGGSSVDTLIAREIKQELLSEAKDLLEKHNQMILEELIDGKEITVPILASDALPVIAIIPPENDEFSFENKYNGKSQEICPAPLDFIDAEKQKQAQEISLKVHQILKARHLSRVDLILKPNGELVVLELNTIPGMTDQSLFPNAARVAGYSMEDLVSKLVKMVVEEE